MPLKTKPSVEPASPKTPSKDQILEEARERAKLAFDVWTKQWDRERDNLRFQVPEAEYQWTAEALKARAGDSQTAARPTLTVSLLDQPIGLIINQMRSADLGVQVHPVSEDADKEGAEARQGIYRFIERDSRAELARGWAYDRAVKVGRGAYRILTEYDRYGGDPADQKIMIKRILHQDSVYFDPSAQEADFSDGEFCFVVTWLTKEQFKRRYPKSKLSKATTEVALEGLLSEAPEWVRDGDIGVAEYWYKVITSETFMVGDQERKKETAAVYCAYLNGFEILEEPYAWYTDDIPIIPVIGRELQPFDDERRWEGMIGPAKDGQRLYNAGLSIGLERALLEPKAPFMAAVESIEGYEIEYQTSNLVNRPVLHWNRGNAANPNPKPERAMLDTTGLSLGIELAKVGREQVQAATAQFDPSLGRVPQQDRSGRAIIALQEQAEAGSSHYLQNLVDISMTCEAQQVLKLMPHIYNRPARVVRIVRGDDRKVEPMMINAPYQMDQQSGRPMAYKAPKPQAMPMRSGMPYGMPMQGGMGPQGGPMGQGQMPPGVHFYDLTAGSYGVAVSIGKSYQTRRQEGAEKLGEFLAAQPALAVALLDIYLRFQDWPGAEEMADRMAKLRETQMPGLSDNKDGKPSIEQLQGQLQKMGQEGKQLQQQLQMAVQALQTEQAKQQAQIMKAQLDAQTKMQQAQLDAQVSSEDNLTKLRIAAADNETKLLIAKMAEDMKVVVETLGLQKEAIIADRQAQNDERDREHQTQMAEKGQEHEAVMSVATSKPPEKGD